ncbi:carbohydrate-binding module family 18 protein [Coniochaeta sp. 2T2.1]|nr:carbohydrate-binding module family 18 protein [Coniochaeta sp. 2T2.1]
MRYISWLKLPLALGLSLSATAVNASQLSPRACTRTVKAQQGDTCASLSKAQGISVSEFLLNNPTITSCDLTAGSSYCVAEDGNGGAPSPSPTPSLVISTDGTCGNGVTCAGSKWGACCSEHGYCGSTNDYCNAGCQAAFGSCGAVSSSTGPPITQPWGTGTVYVTATTVITSTAVTSSTRYTTIAVPGTVTSVVLTTSTVVRTASSVALTTSTVTATSVVTQTASNTAVVTYTSLVFATSTSLVFETSTRVTTSTSLITKTATSLVLGTATVTRTVTADRTAVTTTVVTAACSPTRPDTPITRTTTSRPPSQTPTNVPTPVFPGTVSNCKRYYQIRNNDTCQSIVGGNGITFAQFYAWNPSVSSSPLNNILCVPGLLQLLIDGICKVSCDALWEGYYVCVAA